MAKYIAKMVETGLYQRINVATKAVAWIARLDGGRGGQATFADKASAKRWLAARTAAGVKSSSDARMQTLAEYVTWWLDAKAAGKVYGLKDRDDVPGRRTMYDYRTYSKRWIVEATSLPKGSRGRIGHVRMGQLSGDDFTALYAAMATITTVRTIRAVHKWLIQVMQDRVRQGVFIMNPVMAAHVPKVTTREPKGRSKERTGKAMTEAQFQRLLDEVRALADAEGDAPTHVIPDAAWSAWWHLALLCGLRPGELGALQWNDVRGLDAPPLMFDNGVTIAAELHVRHAVERVPGEEDSIKAPKTDSGTRVVPVLLPVAVELRRWRDVQARTQSRTVKASGLVFTMPSGEFHTDGARRRSWLRVCRKAELVTWSEPPVEREHATGPVRRRACKAQFRPYDCRHTFTSYLRNRGVSDHIVAALVGHKGLHVLPTYTHVQQTDAQAAFKVFASPAA